MFNFPFRGSHWRPRMHTVVVSVDGPCKINNSSDPDSRAAWGVYFGPNDHKNRHGCVSSEYPQTNTRAELEAVKKALDAVHHMKLDGKFDNPYKRHQEVIIRLTSQYVADVFHKYVWEWRDNGWQTSKGQDVVHLPLIQEIHELICKMEQCMGMAVRFWKTDRDAHAQAWANQALEVEKQCGVE
ncbi:hypothetical protein R6Q59_010099 [Mikania micrantha]